VRSLLGILTVGAAAGAFSGRRCGVLMVRQGPDHFERIAERCVAGEVSIHLDRSVPLERTAQALAHVGAGRALGKVVVVPRQRPAGSAGGSHRQPEGDRVVVVQGIRFAVWRRGVR
jgi:hypothetical protein